MSLLRNLLLALSLAVLPVVATLGVTASVVEAQQPPTSPDYDRWNALATKAAAAIENPRVATARLEDLRNQLAEWRDVFSNAQSINSNPIATLQAQLTALGPAPKEGEPAEAPEIASQRKSLNDQLADLGAPVKQAKLAYSKADEMIKSIDAIVRERQTEELLQRGPSPLNPANWSAGANALYRTFAAVRGEITTAFANSDRRSQLTNTLPVTIVLMLIGIVLLVRGRYWGERLVRIVRPRAKTAMIATQRLLSFLISLCAIIVPYVGLLIVLKALSLSGLFDARSMDLLGILKSTLLIFLISRWAATRMFPRGDDDPPPLTLEADDRRAGRLYGTALGFIMSIFHFIHRLGDSNGWSIEARVVVLFPVMVVAGLLLARLARLLAKHSHADDDADEDEQAGGSYRKQLARFLSRLLIAVAVLAPVLAAVGYYKAAVGLMMPSLLSLLLLAALLIIQGVIAELYTLTTRGRDGASEELVPMLAGFVLALASLPLFALLWGARVADLSELWVTFKNGMTLGDLTISPTVFLTFALVFAIGFIVTRVLQGALKTSLLPKTRMEMGARDAIVSGVGYIGIFLAALIAVTSAGIDLSSLAIVAGALSVGIGFGLQNIVSNFVSGIILLIERPISQGDWIEVNGQHGTVREISVRSTRIETFDRSDLIIPNSDLISGTVTNYTKGSTVGRVIVKVGVAYGTDTKWVEGILTEIARAHPMVLMNPPPSVIFMGIGADAFDFQIRAILRDVNFIMVVTSDLNHEIAARFAKEGIEMPYQQRDIWLRNPETLTGAAAGRAQTPSASGGPQTESDDRSAQPQRVEDDGDAGAGDADR